jgi:Kef-type K+ transport system membrane component KefB
LGDTTLHITREHALMSSTNPDSYERERLGAKFWIGLVLAAIACGVGAILAFALFGFAWAAWGLIGAIIAFVALAAAAAWAMDRRSRRRWS